VFLDGEFVCRAVCPELAGVTVSFREIVAARRRHRRELTRTLAERTAVVDELLALRGGQPDPPAPAEAPSPPPRRSTLKTYAEE
jgi:putative transposase